MLAPDMGIAAAVQRNDRASAPEGSSSREVAMSTATRLTYEDYAALPDDGKRYELIDGELTEVTSPSRAHQRLLLRLGGLVEDHADAHDLGVVIPAPFDVVLSPSLVLQPDLLFVRKSRLALLETNACNGAPDLVVEILSPTTRVRDEGIKLTSYAAAGLPECWLAELATRTIRVVDLSSGRAVPVPRPSAAIRSLVLPVLRIDLDTLFSGIA
jgi:Uma2 family endonuclease